jgi:hypothetical protein
MEDVLDSGVSGDVRSERVHGYRPLPKLSEHLRDCGSQISFFRPVSTLMACISCGMVQSEFNGDRNYLPPVQRNRRRGFDQRQQLGLRSLEPDGTNRGVQLALSTRRN